MPGRQPRGPRRHTKLRVRRIGTVPGANCPVPKDASAASLNEPTSSRSSVTLPLVGNLTTGWRRNGKWTPGSTVLCRPGVSREPARSPVMASSSAKPNATGRSPGGMDHRCGVRRYSGASICLSGPGGSITATVRSASISGAFVEISDHGWRPLTTVELSAERATPEGTCICVAAAMIVRVTPHGVGLVFDELNSSLFALLSAQPGYHKPEGAIRAETGTTETIRSNASTAARGAREAAVRS